MSMRHLFRGKRSGNGEWVIGLLCPAPFVNAKSKDERYIAEYSNYPEVKTGGQFFPHRQVDPATIGQCTGEYDIDREMMFEDDVLLVDKDYKTAVRWVNDGFKVKDKDGKLYPLYFFKQSNKIKIIGNSHDNPELLGGS